MKLLRFTIPSLILSVAALEYHNSERDQFNFRHRLSLTGNSINRSLFPDFSSSFKITLRERNSSTGTIETEIRWN